MNLIGDDVLLFCWDDRFEFEIEECDFCFVFGGCVESEFVIFDFDDGIELMFGLIGNVVEFCCVCLVVFVKLYDNISFFL